MALENVKIKVSRACLPTNISLVCLPTNNYEKKRCIVVESISSIDDICLAVCGHFGKVEVEEIWYSGKFQQVVSLNI